MSDVFLNNNGTSATVLSGIRGLVVAEGGLDVAVSYIQVSGWQALSGIIHRLAPNRVLAKHYGFTPEELDFIINYDVTYRMGQDDEDSDDE